MHLWFYVPCLFPFLTAMRKLIHKSWFLLSVELFLWIWCCEHRCFSVHLLLLWFVGIRINWLEYKWFIQKCGSLIMKWPCMTKIVYKRNESSVRVGSVLVEWVSNIGRCLMAEANILEKSISTKGDGASLQCRRWKWRCRSGSQNTGSGEDYLYYYFLKQWPHEITNGSQFHEIMRKEQCCW